MPQRPPYLQFLPWLSLFLVLLSVPSFFVFSSVLESSNQVQITAVVPDSNEQSSSTSSSGRGGSTGGAGASSSSSSNEEDTPNEEEEIPAQGGDNSTSETSQPSSSPAGSSTGSDPKENEQPKAPDSTVYFGGYSFPSAQVTYTLNGTQSYTVQADAEGYFSGTFSTVNLGDNTFSFVAEDFEGNHSNLVSYNYNIQNESPVYIPYILLPPVIYISSSGELEGISIPGSEIQVYGVSADDQSLTIIKSFEVDADGNFILNFDLGKDLDYDQLYLSCSLDGSDCGFSGIMQVQTVGNESRFTEQIFADFTDDIEVNFVDFAFMRAAFLQAKPNLIYDLDQNGVIDLKDFSLLNYQWTL